MTKNRATLIKALIGLVVVLASIPWSTFVATVVWGWFVMPLGLPAIGKAQAFGLMLLIGLFRSYKPSKTGESAETSLTTQVGFYLGGPALTLLLGHIAHRLMS